MPAWLVKMGLVLAKSLVSDEVLKKLVGFIVALILLLLTLVISLPVLVVHIPLVMTENIDDFYEGTEQASNMTKTDDDPKGVVIPWEEVTATWGVLYEQDFSGARVGGVRELALNWAERHERVVVHTDSEGNTWTETIVWYTLRDFTEVMNRLGFITEQKEQAQRFLQALWEGGLKPPADWRARSLPGWAWPVPGYDSAAAISSGYGLRVHPITHVPGTHQGVDIAAPEGTAVVAATCGFVRQTGDDPFLGRFVIIQGGGYETRYGHLRAITVRKGERVKAGETIGRVGNTGRSTGPHLHFEVRFAGQYQNPLQYF